jgi:predicted TIM-barrel fold metal-dependent hydrolase
MTGQLELIDADAHVNPSPTFWDEYLPKEFIGRGPRIEDGAPDEDHDWVVFEGSRKPLNVLQAVSGQGKNFVPTGRKELMRSSNWDPASRLKDMDQDGVRTAILFGGGPLGSADNDLYIASFGAYNRWLADFCKYDPRRLAGAGYLPMQSVDQAIEMLKEAVSVGLKAVNIPAFPQSLGSRSIGGFAAQALALTGDPDGPRQYDDPEFDPFWKVCVDNDVAVTIHLGARIARPGQYRYFPNIVMSKLCMAEPMAILIFGGVFDRFPTLRFGSIESGSGWVAFVAEYLDTVFDNQRHWLKTELKQLPSEYFDTNIYTSFIRDREGIRNRDLPGGRNMMWSTDYPHSETTWPESRKTMDRQFEGLSDEEIRPIVFDNAARFYGLS